MVKVIEGYFEPFGGEHIDIEREIQKYISQGYTLDKFIHLVENKYCAVMVIK